MKFDKYDWVDFYKEFANKLLTYKNNRQDLILKINKIYENSHINFPTLEKESEIIDIDPFTIFGLFNKASMKNENRIYIISKIANLFNIKTPIPNSFESIPFLNNQNATFYNFINERDSNDIDELWSLFEAALDYENNPSSSNKSIFSNFFDLAINKKGNGTSKITMALYWIAPNMFLNLDKRSEWYIYDSGKFDTSFINSLPKIENKISADNYFLIIEILNEYFSNSNSKIKDFKELSSEAWRYSTEVNEKENELINEDVNRVNYWVYSPGDGAFKWDKFYKEGIMGIGWKLLGNLSNYKSKNDIRNAMTEHIKSDTSNSNAALITWQFVHEIKPKDIIFVKKGVNKIIGRGIVESGYYYDENSDSDYPNLRKINWTHNGEWDYPGKTPLKTLTNIKQNTKNAETLYTLCTLFNDIEDKKIIYPSYTFENYLEEVYMTKDNYETLVGLIKTKKNIILQGAPGVGKTYAAKRLAYSIMGVKDQNRVMMIQFHQSYSYEDLIEGYRPTATGFEIKKGSLYKFCKKASSDLENDYFFIIDEINRGNLSKIFGELFMLIENDKRGKSLQLLYSDENFSVPNNVYIIGMMNTADRGLAMIDYALRRRFAFYEMKPGFSSNGFQKYKLSKENKKLDLLIECIENLNEVIINDDSLGEGFCIGHSYFCNLDLIDDTVLLNIIDYEIIPLLKEYWFDEPSKIFEWSNNLRGALK